MTRLLPFVVDARNPPGAGLTHSVLGLPAVLAAPALFAAGVHGHKDDGAYGPCPHASLRWPGCSSRTRRCGSSSVWTGCHAAPRGRALQLRAPRPQAVQWLVRCWLGHATASRGYVSQAHGDEGVHRPSWRVLRARHPGRSSCLGAAQKHSPTLQGASSEPCSPLASFPSQSTDSIGPIVLTCGSSLLVLQFHTLVASIDNPSTHYLKVRHIAHWPRTQE